MKRKLLITLALSLTGCQQEMASQPAYRPLQPSTLFPDGLSARPLVAGTIHRDYQAASGKRSDEMIGWEKAAALVGKLPANPLGAASAAGVDLSMYVDSFPMPLTEKMLQRGQERFNIYCSMCHDRVGNGNGIVVQRGFTPPPNLHTDLSRGFKMRGLDLPLIKAPVGYYFEVMTHGFGAMPDYASQVPAGDRWAIVAYVRALQLSQSAGLADVANEQEKAKLLKSRGKQP
jgi:hypothetical protein